MSHQVMSVAISSIGTSLLSFLLSLLLLSVAISCIGTSLLSFTLSVLLLN